MIDISKKTAQGTNKEEILAGSCDRAAVVRHTITAGASWKPELYPRPEITQMLLFLKGSGYVMTETKAFNICEPALFVPDFDKEPVTVKAVGEDLECLQIISRMNPEDCRQLNKSHMVFPRFRPFSQAWEHTMNIIDGPDSNVSGYVLIENRKLGANNMGIFRSKVPGKSKIDKDCLPTYDQFVIGLAGANCILEADSEQTELKEGDVAFIPRNTEFGFASGENGMIHHVWFTLNRAYDE